MLSQSLYLEQVRQAIEQRPISSTNRWAILWSKGQISIWPSTAMYKAEFVIWHLTEKEVLEGLKSDQWETIVGRIRSLIKNLHCESSSLPCEIPALLKTGDPERSSGKE